MSISFSDRVTIELIKLTFLPKLSLTILTANFVAGPTLIAAGDQRDDLEVEIIENQVQILSIITERMHQIPHCSESSKDH